MLSFPKSRFPTCSSLRFSDSLENPYPACFLMPNSQLFSCRFRVIILRRFLNLCLVSSLLLLIWLVISVIPLWASAEKLLSTIIGKLLTVWRGILQKFFRTPFTIYGHLQPILWGVFLKIFYTPSLLLESFKPFVGVFLKKFRKFSHRVVSRFFNHPQFILENSVHKPRPQKKEV